MFRRNKPATTEQPAPTTSSISPEDRAAIEEAVWRDKQETARSLAEDYITMDEAMKMLDKPRAYIIACETLGTLFILRKHGVEHVGKYDVEAEARRIKAFPHPPTEDATENTHQ